LVAVQSAELVHRRRVGGVLNATKSMPKKLRDTRGFLLERGNIAAKQSDIKDKFTKKRGYSLRVKLGLV